MRSWNRIIFYIILLVLYLLGYNCYSVNVYASNLNKDNNQLLPLKDKRQQISSNNVTNDDKEVPPVSKNISFVDKKSKKNVINALNVTSEGIEIISDSSIGKYKTFTLSKPQRLVLDIYNVKTKIKANSISLNSFGIKNARLGIYPDKVRIVFDSLLNKFPQHKLEKLKNGLIILLSSNSKKEETPQADPVKEKSDTAQIESIDFNVTDKFSRITLKANQSLNLAQPTIKDKTIVILAKNCVLKKNLQRPLNTVAFPSSVLDITPYQFRMNDEKNVKILIKLREIAAYNINKEGNTVYIEVQNVNKTEPKKQLSAENRPTVTAPQKARVPAPVHNEPISTSQIDHAKKSYTGARVTLEFVDADIRKIFQLIAEVSNLNFVLGDDVKGTISIKLVNVPWDQALDVILDTKGLGMQREGNIVLIRPIGKIKTLAEEQQAEKRASERAMELRTKVFDVNFASISDIAAQFNNLKSERGVIAQDPRTNRIIVSDIDPAIEKMTFLLKTLDIPEKQVMIEARIVEATSTFTRDLGVQWGIHYKDGSASFLGINQLDSGFGGVVTSVAPTSGLPDPATAGGSMGLSFGKLTNNIQLDLRLSAAETAGQVKIISTPKVVTLNNKAAKISQGQSIPYQTTSAEGTKTEFVEAALTLEVTPHITANGDVSMKIKASNNSPGSPVQGSTAPPINKKEATTELLVKNGETTVIGGIYVNNESSSDSGVPFLKDIPLLGWMFKSNSKSTTKTELLIFITPKIVA
jgi:type IV pilus assembly protein PilQ